MYKIIKYSFADLVRSRWSYFYFAFYLILSMSLLFLNRDLSKAIITLMNIIVVLTPLIGTIFGVMVFYNSREFTELLLAQPITRRTIFVGQFLGTSLSLALSLILGVGVPFVLYGLFQSGEIVNFVFLLIAGAMLSFTFVGLSFSISLLNDNKIKGFGFAILLWLFMAVIYDGLFLIFLIIFKDYPLDNFSLVMSMANPVDLSRILILLKLDIAALLGYTGAVFQKFFGTPQGLIISLSTLLLWSIAPVWLIDRLASKKDF